MGVTNAIMAQLQRRELETPYNKSPLVRAVAAFLMVVAVLSVLTRLATRLLTSGSMKLDDHLVITATVLAAAQSVVVIVQGAHGFGQHDDALHDGQIPTILKCMYAANILFIVALGFTKISAATTVMNVAPLDRRRGVFGVMILVALWTASALFTVLFQCEVSQPWNFISAKCIDLPAFWTYFSIGNIVTDLAIIAALVELIWNIQAKRSMKALVFFIFGSRIIVTPAAIAYIIYMKRAVKAFETSRETFDFWPPVIINQVIQCLSLAAACIPYLKPFMDNLESGQMRAGDALMYIKTRSGNSGSNTNASGGKSKKNSRLSRKGNETPSNAAPEDGSKQFQLSVLSNQKGTRATTTVMAHEEGQASWDGTSQSSQTVLVQQSWRVDVEARPSTER